MEGFGMPGYRKGPRLVWKLERVMLVRFAIWTVKGVCQHASLLSTEVASQRP